MTKRATYSIIAGVILVVVVFRSWSMKSGKFSVGPGAINTAISDTLTKFTPTDAIPLALGSKGQFILAAQNNGTNLYIISVGSGSAAPITLPAAAVSATLNPSESLALVHIAQDADNWLVIDIAKQTITTLNHLVAADWLDDATLVVVSDQKKVGQLKIGTRIVTPNAQQPDFGTDNVQTVESKKGLTLVGSSNNTEDLAPVHYWLIDSAQKLTATPFNSVVWATLTPDVQQVFAFTTDPAPLKYLTLANTNAGTLDSTKLDLPIIGMYKDQYVTVYTDTTTEATPFWRFSFFTPGKEVTSKKITAPVTWNPKRIFIAGDVVYAYGEGLLYHGNITTLLNAAP